MAASENHVEENHGAATGTAAGECFAGLCLENLEAARHSVFKSERGGRVRVKKEGKGEKTPPSK